MRIRPGLIDALADGAVHSGSALAARLGCSRTAVWKHVHELARVGLVVDAVPGRGYRLQVPFERLDAGVIRAMLDAPARAAVGRLEVFDVMESTSEHLRRGPGPVQGRFDVALAEFQTGGRGRRGREWLSPFGSGLCLSVARRLESVPADLPALSLALGVGVCRVLDDLAPGAGIGVKWPNDIVVADRKLGGLLVDLRGESNGPMIAVAGIGLNVDLTPGFVAAVDAAEGLSPAGLRELAPGRRVSRNELAARIVATVGSVFDAFEGTGFDSFVTDWQRFDRMVGRAVTVSMTGQEPVAGTARGVDRDGALLLEERGRLRRVLAGDVEAHRPAAGPA